MSFPAPGLIYFLSLAILPAAAREIAFAPSLARARGAQVEMVSIDTTQEVRPATPFRFALADYQTLSIEIFDREGRRIRTLSSGLWAPGTHQLAWQRDNDAGERVVDGIYEIRLSQPSAGPLLGR